MATVLTHHQCVAGGMHTQKETQSSTDSMTMLLVAPGGSLDYDETASAAGVVSKHRQGCTGTMPTKPRRRAPLPNLAMNSVPNNTQAGAAVTHTVNVDCSRNPHTSRNTGSNRFHGHAVKG